MNIDIEQALQILIPSILSFISGLFIYKLRNSIIKLRRRITIQTLANSFNNEFWGNIQITHNNREIKHLHFVRIELLNGSSKDVDPFKLQLTVGDSNRILSSHAINMDTRAQLQETEGFQLEMSSGNWEYLNTHREYHCEVLNRNTNITIHLLVESFDEVLNEEEIIVAIQKRGVKINNHKTLSSDTLGAWGLLIGTSVVILTSIGCYIYFPQSTIPIIILGIIGSLNIFIGIFIYYSIIGWHHWNDDN